MQNKLFVGNLNYNASEDDLKNLFKSYGAVQNIEIVRDKYSGQSKGFGFIEMSSPEEAQKALELNGQEMLGRSLSVSMARPPKPRGEERRGGGGGGFNRRRGGGGGRNW
jgi:RNA recognition motif-containing protein